MYKMEEFTINIPKNRIREICKQKGTTINRLALDNGIAPCTFYQIANGKIYPYKGWREVIAKSLNMSEKEIFFEDLEETPELEENSFEGQVTQECEDAMDEMLEEMSDGELLS